MDGGHYTSYIKHKGLWFLCDDSLIYPATQREVTQCNGYLLFFIKNELNFK